jgi:hypothetical protein
MKILKMHYRWHRIRLSALCLCCISLFICLGSSTARGDGNWGKIALDHRRANLYYHDWFKELDETDASLDVTVVIRVRAFGKRSDMIEAWNKNWQNRIPDWNWDKALGCIVSSGSFTDIPEVWLGINKDNDGNLVLPMNVLGHEVAHAIHSIDRRVGDPDNLMKIEVAKPSKNNAPPGIPLKGFPLAPYLSSGHN